MTDDYDDDGRDADDNDNVKKQNKYKGNRNAIQNKKQKTDSTKGLTYENEDDTMVRRASNALKNEPRRG